MNQKSRRSLIAAYFYDETKYREGSASERIVSEIDKLWEQGEHSVTIDLLTATVERRHPILKEQLVSIEERVRKVVSWAKSKGLIVAEGDMVKIIPE